MKRFFLLCVLLVLGAGLFAAKRFPVQLVTLRTASGEEIPVKVEMARSPEEREQGFMGRKHIPDGTGMLFVFSTDQVLYFWMKNTPHALSIAYIDRNGVIRDIFDMTPLSLAHVVSSTSVRYALEVPQGWFERAGVKKGDSLVLDF